MTTQLMTFQEFCRRTESSTAGPNESMRNYMTHYSQATDVAPSTTPEGLIEVLEMIERVAESEDSPENFSDFMRDTPSIADSRLYVKFLAYRVHVLEQVSRCNQRREEQVRRPAHHDYRPQRPDPDPQGEQERSRYQSETRRDEPRRREASARGWVRERAPQLSPRNEQPRDARQHEHQRREANERGWVRERTAQSVPRNEQPRQSRQPEAPLRQATARGWIRERAPRSGQSNNGHRHRHRSNERREHHQLQDLYERNEHRHRPSSYEQSEHLQFRPSGEGGYHVEERSPQGVGRSEIHRDGADLYERSITDHLEFQSGSEGGYYVEERAPQNARRYNIQQRDHHPSEQNEGLHFQSGPGGGYYVEERSPRSTRQPAQSAHFPTGYEQDAELNAALAESLREFERDYERVIYSGEDSDQEMVEYEPVTATTPDFYSQYENGLNPFGEPLPERRANTTAYEAPIQRMPTGAERSEKCLICLDPPTAIETVTVLPCIGHPGHWFHHHCISDWIRMKRVQDCPLRCAQRPAS